MKTVLPIWLVVFATILAAQEADFSRAMWAGYDAQGKSFDAIRENRPLTEDERQRMIALADLPTPQAVSRLAWHVAGSTNPEANQLARETFLKIPGWKEEMSRLLEEAARAKTPEQAFGADFERRRMLGQLTPQEKEELKKLPSVLPSRGRQQELGTVLRMLKSPEAVPLIAPYLFDEAKPIPYPGERLQVTGPMGYVISTLIPLVPDLPRWNVSSQSEEEYVRLLRQWWLANAHRYGADPHWRPAPLVSSTADAGIPPPPSHVGSAQTTESAPFASATANKAFAPKPAILTMVSAIIAMFFLGAWFWKRRQ